MPSSAESIRDRGQGALLGLAVGDALGAALEFTRRDSRPFLTEMIGGGPFGLEPGQWTDDTAMALALADSLITCQGFDPGDLMSRFVAWWREGRYSCTGSCFDIGLTTAQALRYFEQTGDRFAGSTDRDSAGNGSLMRLAPAVMFALRDAALTDTIARDQSRTTHGAPEAVDACAFFAELLREAVLGGSDPLRPQTWTGEQAVRAIAAGAWRGKSRAAIRSSGYVIDTLEAAVWSVGSTDNFEDALVLAVNLGHDSDTVGAVTGQLAGARYGASGIPNRWLKTLAWRHRIGAVADQLLDFTD